MNRKRRHYSRYAPKRLMALLLSAVLLFGITDNSFVYAAGNPVESIENENNYDDQIFSGGVQTRI